MNEINNDPQKKIEELEYELNRSIEIEKKLVQRLAKKDHEMALLEVKLDEVARGFEALRKKYEGTEMKAE